MNVIVVEIDGGCCVSVRSNFLTSQEVKIVIKDYDNMRAGDDMTPEEIEMDNMCAEVLL